jgi:hypothetical protein
MMGHLIPTYMMVVVRNVKSDGCLRDARLSPVTVSGAQKMMAISLMACTTVLLQIQATTTHQSPS